VGADKPFQGVTLTIPMLEWPPTTITRELTPEFEKQTGMKIRYDVLPWEPAHEKITLELAAGNRTYDVMTIDNQWVGELIRPGYLMPLPWKDWKEDAEFDYGDIIEAFLEAYGSSFGKPGVKYVFLFATDAPVVFYRKDLFNDPRYRAEFQQEYGRELRPAVTWAEYLDLAKFFTRDTNGDGNIDLYGATMMGARGDPLACDVRVYIYGHGGDILDENLVPVLNNEIGVEAIEYYVDLYRKHKVVPPGSTTYGYDEVLAAMQTGKVAMMENWQTFWPSIQDPAASQVVGKIGGAVLPRTPEMDFSRSNLGGWGIAISNYSQNKEAALEYVKWFLSKQTQLQYARRGGTAGRSSVYSDPEVIKAVPHADAYVKAMQYGIPVLSPVLPEFMEIDSINALEVSKALAGMISVKEALDRAAAKIEYLLSKAGYYD